MLAMSAAVEARRRAAAPPAPSPRRKSRSRRRWTFSLRPLTMALPSHGNYAPAPLAAQTSPSSRRTGARAHRATRRSRGFFGAPERVERTAARRPADCLRPAMVSDRGLFRVAPRAQLRTSAKASWCSPPSASRTDAVGARWVRVRCSRPAPSRRSSAPFDERSRAGDVALGLSRLARWLRLTAVSGWSGPSAVSRIASARS